MMGSSLRITTTVSSRIIRQCFQALLKSKAISGGYKIPYVKSYHSDEKGRTATTNIQIMVLTPSLTREKSGEQILNNILKEWQYMDENRKKV